MFFAFYENYTADTILSGAEPIFVSPYVHQIIILMFLNWKQLFKQNPKAIILCNPSNPTGKVFTYDELKIIADLEQKNMNTFVITDEVL